MHHWRSHQKNIMNCWCTVRKFWFTIEEKIFSPTSALFLLKTFIRHNSKSLLRAFFHMEIVKCSNWSYGFSEKNKKNKNSGTFWIRYYILWNLRQTVNSRIEELKKRDSLRHLSWLSTLSKRWTWRVTKIYDSLFVGKLLTVDKKKIIIVWFR